MYAQDCNFVLEDRQRIYVSPDVAGLCLIIAHHGLCWLGAAVQKHLENEKGHTFSCLGLPLFNFFSHGYPITYSQIVKTVAN